MTTTPWNFAFGDFLNAHLVKYSNEMPELQANFKQTCVQL
jgi:hypothetical protein